MTSARITVMLDHDVAALITNAQRRERKPLDQVINEALRRGLAQDPPGRPTYRVRPHHSAVRPGIDVNALNRLADQVTGGD